MKSTHYLWISSAHAVVFTSILGFLHVFKFISWNPINWTKIQIFSQTHISVKWLLTLLVVFMVINIVMGLFLIVKKMPVVITSIVVGSATWLLLEWSIYQNFTHIKWSSIPILTVIILICRALAETINYYDREVYEDKRK